MKAIISVLSDKKVVYHTTEDFENAEIEMIKITKALPENRLYTVLETIRLSHKGFDLKQITKISVFEVKNGIGDELVCDKSVEHLKENF